MFIFQNFINNLTKSSFPEQAPIQDPKNITYNESKDKKVTANVLGNTFNFQSTAIAKNLFDKHDELNTGESFNNFKLQIKNEIEEKYVENSKEYKDAMSRLDRSKNTYDLYTLAVDYKLQNSLKTIMDLLESLILKESADKSQSALQSDNRFIGLLQLHWLITEKIKTMNRDEALLEAEKHDPSANAFYKP